MNVFEKFGLSNELLTAIKGLRYTEPTQIQELSIPPIIKGEDVIGESATGSGKTLAFGQFIKAFIAIVVGGRIKPQPYPLLPSC